MSTNDNTFLKIHRLMDTLLADLKTADEKPSEERNEEYRSRLIHAINDLNKLKAYY